VNKNLNDFLSFYLFDAFNTPKKHNVAQKYRIAEQIVSATTENGHFTPFLE